MRSFPSLDTAKGYGGSLGLEDEDSISIGVFGAFESHPFALLGGMVVVPRPSPTLGAANVDLHADVPVHAAVGSGEELDTVDVLATLPVELLPGAAAPVRVRAMIDGVLMLLVVPHPSFKLVILRDESLGGLAPLGIMARVMGVEEGDRLQVGGSSSFLNLNRLLFSDMLQSLAGLN